jgi:hypothetical protein
MLKGCRGALEWSVMTVTGLDTVSLSHAAQMREDAPEAM